MMQLHWASHYTAVPYLDEGRDLSGWDCFGAVRYLLHSHYGKPLMDSFGRIRAGQLRAMSSVFSDLQTALVETNHATEGAVACQFRGKYLAHVAIVVGPNLIFQATSARGSELLSVREFERQSLLTRYFVYDPYLPQ